MTKLANDLRLKHSKVFTQSENIKTDVLNHQKTVLDLRSPHPEPKVLQIISYVIYYY